MKVVNYLSVVIFFAAWFIFESPVFAVLVALILWGILWVVAKATIGTFISSQDRPRAD